MHVGDIVMLQRWMYCDRPEKPWCRIDAGTLLIITSIVDDRLDQMLIRAIETDHVCAIRFSKADVSFFFKVIGSAQSE